MKNLNQNEFNQIKSESGIKVVDFYADWCGPCKMLGPVLQELSLETENVTFIKINIDENMELAQEYQVTTIPTVVFLKDGIEESRKIGFMPKNSILEEISKYI